MRVRARLDLRAGILWVVAIVLAAGLAAIEYATRDEEPAPPAPVAEPPAEVDIEVVYE